MSDETNDPGLREEIASKLGKLSIQALRELRRQIDGRLKALETATVQEGLAKKARVEMVAVAVKRTAIRCRLLETGELVTLRPGGGMREEAEGHILTVTELSDPQHRIAAEIAHIVVGAVAAALTLACGMTSFLSRPRLMVGARTDLLADSRCRFAVQTPRFLAAHSRLIGPAGMADCELVALLGPGFVGAIKPALSCAWPQSSKAQVADHRQFLESS